MKVLLCLIHNIHIMFGLSLIMSAFPDRSLQPSGQDGSKDVELWAFEALWSETWASKCDGKKWRFVGCRWLTSDALAVICTVSFYATVIMTHDISWPCHEVIYLCVSNCICMTHIYRYIYIRTHLNTVQLVEVYHVQIYCTTAEEGINWPMSTGGLKHRCIFLVIEQEPPSGLQVLRCHVNSL